MAKGGGGSLNWNSEGMGGTHVLTKDNFCIIVIGPGLVCD